MAIESRLHDAILTTMDNVIVPRVEMVVRSITLSSGGDLAVSFKNPDLTDFSRNTEITSPMSASSRVDLNNDQNRMMRLVMLKTPQDGDFPALRTNHDRQVDAHHSYKKN